MNDISHAFNNVLKKSLKAIPPEIMKIINGISSHFHYSTQRSSMLREVLIEEKMKPLEILHIATTRWLSLRDNLECILELWDGLKKYFQKNGTKTEKDYFTEENETSLKVLALLVKRVSDYNEFFQNDQLFYNEIIDTLKESYVMMSNSILKKEEKSMDFEKLFQIPWEKNNNKEILAGDYSHEIKKELVTNKEFKTSFLSSYDSIKECFEKLKPEAKEKLINASVKFLYLSLKNMKERLPYSNKEIEASLVIFFEEDFNLNKWLGLKDLLPNILKQKKMKDDYVSEVKKLEYSYKKIQNKMTNGLQKISPIKIWQNLASSYPTIYLVARALLVLPYTSIPVERVFSALKDIKNQKRNRLSTENVEALLLGYQYFRSQKLEITVEMFDNYLEMKEAKSKKKKVLITSKSFKSETQDPIIPIHSQSVRN